MSDLAERVAALPERKFLAAIEILDPVSEKAEIGALLGELRPPHVTLHGESPPAGGTLESIGGLAASVGESAAGLLGDAAAVGARQALRHPASARCSSLR